MRDDEEKEEIRRLRWEARITEDGMRYDEKGDADQDEEEEDFDEELEDENDVENAHEQQQGVIDETVTPKASPFMRPAARLWKVFTNLVTGVGCLVLLLLFLAVVLTVIMGAWKIAAWVWS